MSRVAEVRGELYHSRLAKNLRRLIHHQAGSVNAWALRFELPQSTINKICRGQRDATVSVLEQIEEKTGYAPWQLLHPDFDPETMPPTADPRAMRVAAVFAAITDPKDRDRAEAIIEQFAPAAVSAGEPAPTAQPLRAP